MALVCFQNIVAEEREVQAMEKIRKEEEKAIREKAREEARKRREAKRKERMDLNDFKIKGLKEWEINYEFHIGMNTIMLPLPSQFILNVGEVKNCMIAICSSISNT
jgi:hypothetical protein